MSFHRIDKWAAVAIVIANMVGTGVFTSLGFQLLSIDNAWSICILWAAGGIIALSGALSYAEIGSYLIRNGGEYHYLSCLFHPSIGFVAGFISVIVGFAAPIAAASVAFGKYFTYSFFTENSTYTEVYLSLSILFIIGGIHLLSIKTGSVFQKYITLLKLFIMLIFLMAFFHPNRNTFMFDWDTQIVLKEVFSSKFAVSLIYVSYAYSGWNAASYIAGEIEHPQKNLSYSLVAGTFIVMLFYVMLNLSFLYSTPVDALKGNVEVGIISAQYIFGNTYGNIIGFLISLLLVSTISSMLIASPRVLSIIGEDYRVFSVFNKKNRFLSPYVALLTIVLLAALMAVTSSFQWLINLIGITLILFTILTTFSIFILRKQKDYSPAFKLPLYPFTPLFFILANVWILIYVSIQEYTALIASLSIILLGFLIYRLIVLFT